VPIEGQRHIGPRNVPVYKKGERTTVHPNRVKPYDLESAEKLVTQVRQTIHTTGYEYRSMLQDQIDHLCEFARAADEVVAACDSEISRLKKSRDQLHSKAPAERFDSALSNLEIAKKRHLRMRARIHETVTRARHAWSQWRDKGEGPPDVAERDRQRGNLRREISDLNRR